MRVVTVHIRDGRVSVVTMPDSVEVDIINFDEDNGVGQRYRYFTYDGDIMEEVQGPPNVIEGRTGGAYGELG